MKVDESSLVTVLIPAYNVEKYIREAIDSVCAQTYSNLDILIINDGSTDQTSRILQELSETDSRIRIVTNEHNIGLIKSLNKGILLAKGEYIARTDADDRVERNWIETIIGVMEKSPSILACGSYVRAFSDEVIGDKEGIWEYPLDYLEVEKQMLFSCPMAHPTVVIRKEVFTAYDLKYDEKYPYAEDYKLWFEISKKGEIRNIAKALVNYRLHLNQVSKTKAEIQAESAKKVRRDAINLYFSKKNIDFSLPNDGLSYQIVREISKNVDFFQDKDIGKSLLYEFYLSVSDFTWKNLYSFAFCKKNNEIFSLGERVKIIKKYFRPCKYKNPLY